MSDLGGQIAGVREPRVQRYRILVYSVLNAAETEKKERRLRETNFCAGSEVFNGQLK